MKSAAPFLRRVHFATITRMLRTIASSIVTIAILSSTARADDSLHTVRLDRPDTIGQISSIIGSATYTRTWTPKAAGAPHGKPEKKNVQLEGTVKVLEIEPNCKMATKVLLTVKKLILDKDDLVPPGTEIVAESTGDSVKYEGNCICDILILRRPL